MSEQPFIPAVGGDVQASGGTYIRRLADEQLLQACLNNQFAYVLASRQIGKSSLKNAVAEHLIEKGVRVARIDLNRIGREEVTSETWYFGLLDEIARTLDLEIDAEEWWDNQPPFSPLAQRFVHFFDEIVLTKIQQPIVVFIDEIDVTLDLPFTNDLFAIIRSFHNDRAQNPSYRRLTFVLLGVASPDELINDPKRTPFNIGKAIEMRDFQREECEPLRLFTESKHPGKGGNYFKKIYEWTNGHPYLTQKLCVAISKTDTADSPNLIDGLVNEIFFKEGERIEENLHFVQTRVLQDKYTGQMLQTYAKILRHHTVRDDKKSPAINRLSLYGLVVAKNGILRVRNKIYERAFDYEWYRKNRPHNWNQIVIVILGLIVAFFLSINLYNFKVNQDATAIADNFQNQSAKIQVERLATLLSLKHLNLQYFNSTPKDFADQAQSLFFSLSGGEQAELFKLEPPDAKIIPVIQGIYTTLADVYTPGSSTWLLQAMVDALDELPETPEKNILSEEIKSWVVGRNFSKQGQDKQALDAYNKAIALNGANESTRYERARVYFKLTQPEKALTDLNQIIAALKQSGAPTPIVSSVILTVTPTATFTPLPTLTSTTISSTPTGTTSTSKITSTFTKVTPSNTPTTIPSTPTATPAPNTVISDFSRSDQIIVAIRNLINKNSKIISVDPQSNQQIYSNLVAFGLVPTPTPVAVGIALVPTPTPSLSPTPTSSPASIAQVATLTAISKSSATAVNTPSPTSKPTRVGNLTNLSSATPTLVIQFPTKIGFVSSDNIDNNDSTIQTMDIQKQQIHPIVKGFDPSWSPDGTTIVYGSAPGIISIVDSLTKNSRVLTNQKDWQPVWSPDGKQIVFMSERTGKKHIYKMDRNGQNQVQLTNATFEDRHPAWSPDGNTIAFISNRSGKWQIWLMTPTGANQVQLTDGKYDYYKPTWSPTGEKLVFGTWTGSQNEIWTIDKNGQHAQRLITNFIYRLEGSGYGLSWSSNGWIAYVNNMSDKTQIYAIMADGSNNAKVTDNKTSTFFPVWLSK